MGSIVIPSSPAKGLRTNSSVRLTEVEPTPVSNPYIESNMKEYPVSTEPMQPITTGLKPMFSSDVNPPSAWSEMNKSNAGTNNNSAGVSGINLSVSGENAQIHVSQTPPVEEVKSVEGNKPTLTVSDILGITDMNQLNGVIKQLEYALRVAEAKKLIIEAHEAVKSGEVS